MKRACIGVVVLGMETRSQFAGILVIEPTGLGSWVIKGVGQEQGGVVKIVKHDPKFKCLY